jgi:hypothetical protein
MNYIIRMVRKKADNEERKISKLEEEQKVGIVSKEC